MRACIGHPSSASAGNPSSAAAYKLPGVEEPGVAITVYSPQQMWVEFWCLLNNCILFTTHFLPFKRRSMV